MVADVAPFELAKLRLLNGSHSTLAYLGYLAGYETIADAMADASLARLIGELMEAESAPTLDAGAAGDLKPYMRELKARFRNPALRHRTWQIAMDGSQKLPQRLLGTVRARLAKNQKIDRLALGVAAWMRYVTGIDEKGRPIDVRDPLAARLKAIADREGFDAARLARALADVREVFGADLAGNPRFMSPVTAALAKLVAMGSRRTAADYASIRDRE
jgi:fructuronate reductase